MTSRWVLLAGAMAASIVPGQILAQSAPVSAFNPPAAPLVLTRTVWRTLGDGKQIIVSRRYRISFARQGNGFVLDGEFIDASVEAPSQLASMAQVERTRQDRGPFPIRLDATGRIRDDQAGGGPGPAIPGEALKQGQDLIGKASLPAEQRREASILLAQLALQRAASAWPSDLFNPQVGERHEHREITLPDGQEGGVEVTLSVRPAATEGLPATVERTVTTALAGSLRVSKERWSFESASPAHP